MVFLLWNRPLDPPTDPADPHLSPDFHISSSRKGSFPSSWQQCSHISKALLIATAPRVPEGTRSHRKGSLWDWLGGEEEGDDDHFLHEQTT